LGSVETVTVLFTDLVGSTGLATRVGPAAAEELRREHFGLLREAVEASGGREVKNVGDGLMVVFQSSSAAVGCAVSMQQRLDRRNRHADEQLMIRVGVSAGEADLEDGDYFGPPVVEAARLCNATGGGQILCGELVRMMAREGHAFVSVGGLELKGLAEPFPAFEVEWEAGDDTGAIPLPPRLRGVPPLGYVGRRTEREGLAFLLEQAREGSRRVAFVSGEPGIGKTRLTTHVAVEAHGDGATVLYGRCDEEVTAPYGPWVQALGYLISELDEQVLRDHVESHGAHLARLLPELGRRLPDLEEPSEGDPDTDRYLLFGAVAGLLELAGAEAPVVLILDDLHWTDRPSLGLLRHLVTQGGAMRLVLLGTYRDSDLTRSHPLTELLADLRREPEVSRVPLSGIDEDDVIAIMAAAAGHEIDSLGRRLARTIAQETDGNPFYVSELLRHLVECGALKQGADGRFALEGEIEDLGLPQSVREVVGRRVARLSEQTQRLLGVAAVIGRDFDVGLLTRLVEAGEDDVLDMLDEAIEASVVNESSGTVGRFTFAHALVNATLYEDLGNTRRARLHRRIGEALEDICGAEPGARAGELAHHWIQATTPDDRTKAVGYARQAGERALAELAPDDAVHWFDQALELQEDAPTRERCTLLVGLGEAQRLSGEGDFRATLLDAGRLAVELGDVDLLVRACLANTRGQASSHGGVDDERVQLLEAAIEAAGTADPARHARLLALLAMELNWHPDNERTQRLAAEALDLARSSGDDRTLAVVLEHASQATQTNVHDRHRLSLELIDVAGRTKDPVTHFYALWVRLITAGELGDFETVDDSLEGMREVIELIGAPTLRWSYLYARSARERILGRLDAAEASAEEAAEIGEPDAFMIYAAQLQGVRFEQGRTDEVLELMEMAVEDFPGISAFQPAAIMAHVHGGDHDRARELLEAWLDRGIDAIRHDQAELTALVMTVEVAFALRSESCASELYERLALSSDLVVWNSAVALNAVHHYLGGLAALMGRHDEAGDHFERAVQIQQRVGAPLWLARTRHWWGQTLLERDAPGDGERARTMLAEAVELAEAHGAEGTARDARALLTTAVA
jgi:class 3 adenylate cyclase/tetratricopeptide (TPR) repeat protein